jgi:hypothetical protein
MECLAEVVCQLSNANNGFWIVAIYMEHRSLDSASYVGGVNACAAVLRGCCETNLVIDYQVNGSTNAVALKLTHLQSFSNDTLTGNPANNSISGGGGNDPTRPHASAARGSSSTTPRRRGVNQSVNVWGKSIGQ